MNDQMAVIEPQNDPSKNRYQWLHPFKAFQKYSERTKLESLRQIDDLLDEQNTEALIELREADFLGNDEQFMRRVYGIDEFGYKIQKLSEYFKFHRNIPRVLDLPIERILCQYYSRCRHLDYKRMKIQLKQQQDISMTTQNSPSSFSDTEIEQKRSKYSDMLGSLRSIDRTTETQFLQCFCQKVGEQEILMGNFKKNKEFPKIYNTSSLRNVKKKPQIQLPVLCNEIKSIHQDDSDFEAYLRNQLDPQSRKYSVKHRLNHKKTHVSRFKQPLNKKSTPHESIQKESRQSNKQNAFKHKFRKSVDGTKTFKRLVDKGKSNNQTISQQQKNQAHKTNNQTNSGRMARGNNHRRIIALANKDHSTAIIRNSVTRRKSNLKLPKENYQMVDLQKEERFENQKSSTVFFRKQKKSSLIGFKKNATIDPRCNKARQIFELKEAEMSKQKSKSVKRILKPSSSVQRVSKIRNDNKEEQLSLKRNESNQNLLNKKSSSKNLLRSNSVNQHPKSNRQSAKENMEQAFRYASSNLSKDLMLQSLLRRKLQAHRPGVKLF